MSKRLHSGKEKGDAGMNKTSKKDTRSFVIPGFIGILIFVILPLVDVVGRSFRLGGMGRFAGIANYKMVLFNDAFRLAAGNTFRFEIVSVPLLMLLSLFVSIEVYNMKSNIVRFAFLIPMVIPSNAMAVVWKILFADAGIVNNILVNGLHWEPVSFFEGKAVYALFVGTFVFKNIGYNMLIWIAGLSAVPQEIYDAAKVDGAGSFQTVWHITLPNIRRPAFIAAVLSMVNSFKIFRELYLIAGNYPDKTVYQLQHVFNNWFSKLDISKLTAGAVFTALAFFGTILIIWVMFLTEWKSKLRRIWNGRKQKGRGDNLPEESEEEGEQCGEKKKRVGTTRWVRYILKGIVLAMAILSVLPLVILICGAFTGENELYQMLGAVIGTEGGYAGWHFIPLYPTLKNMIELFFDTPEYYVLFWNSIKIVGIILVGQLVFATPAAWGLAKCKGKWGGWVFGLYMFCMILPFQVTMLSQYIVLNGMHLINTHWAIILPLLFSTFPVFIMYSSFEEIPDSVVEAAKMDGAGSLCIFLRIAVPVAKKGIVAAVILGFLEYWNIVEQPVVFLKDKALWPLSVYLPDIAQGSIGRTFTFALFSCIPPLVVFYMGKDILADGISIGSAED